MRVIISAAGTGGHINPGIVIANTIKEKYRNAEIVFIGTNRGLENDLVPRAGYKLKTIEAYGIKNKKLNLKELTWQEDGKTIEDRIHSYCYGVKELVSTTDEAILKRLLVYNMTC